MGRKIHKRPKKQLKAKHFKRQFDQIFEDVKFDNRKKLENQQIDFDIPGNAQYYCVECVKYCINEKALGHHKKSKSHRRKVNDVKNCLVPYSIEESVKAAGFGNYNNKKDILQEVMLTD